MEGTSFSSSATPTSSNSNHHHRLIKTEPVDNPCSPPLEEDDAIPVPIPGPFRRKRGGGVGSGGGDNNQDEDGRTTPPIPTNLNEQLRKLGFGEPAEEPRSTKRNHDARDRFSLLRPDEQADYNKEQICEMMCYDLVKANLNTSDNACKITLKGPWSPLELRFSSLCQSSNTKEVQIGHNSVNSMVLDTEPTAPIFRLLVASSVGIQDGSGNMVPRETTIMPAVRGMLSLMSMIFAPKVELRTDVTGTMYTGVLCGLGTTRDGDAVYGDHDIEVVFDTVIDDGDIDSINTIRHLMNLILKKPPKKEGQQLRPVNPSPYQSGLKTELLKLLKCKREPISNEEQVSYRKEFIWNQIRAESLIPPEESDFSYELLDIFAPLSKVKLTKDNSVGLNWNFPV